MKNLSLDWLAGLPWRTSAPQYWQLLQAELAYARWLLRQRTLALLLTLVSLSSALTLSGIALLLAPLYGEPGWLLWLIPLLPWLLFAVSGYLLLRPASLQPFATLQQQLGKDWRDWQERVQEVDHER